MNPKLNDKLTERSAKPQDKTRTLNGKIHGVVVKAHLLHIRQVPSVNCSLTYVGKMMEIVSDLRNVTFEITRKSRLRQLLFTSFNPSSKSDVYSVLYLTYFQS
jgi:hypothetical protein